MRLTLNPRTVVSLGSAGPLEPVLGLSSLPRDLTPPQVILYVEAARRGRVDVLAAIAKREFDEALRLARFDERSNFVYI